MVNGFALPKKRYVSLALAIALASLAACEASSDVTVDDPAMTEAGAPDVRDDTADPPPECTPRLVSDPVVPAPYAGLRSPLSPTATVVAAGKARFVERCALCHGQGGRGDGMEGPFFPPAADLVGTLRPEDYLFWRISEGGNVEPFCTAMPSFGRLYAERTRWELVVYIRDLATSRDASDPDADAAEAGD